MNKNKIKDISLAFFSRYLLKKGWTNPSNLATASLWYNPENTDGISLPLTEDSSQYLRHIQNALSDLAEIEQRNISEILEDIMQYHEDKVFIRVIGEKVKNGTIPLNDGVKLFEYAKGFITSLAQSTQKPKAFYNNINGKNVQDFLDTVQLGQTQIGSYIIELRYPVENIKTEQQDYVSAISFSRSVSHNLMNSITKLKEKVAQYTDDPSIFGAVILDGVSNNLCEAIVGLSGSNQNQDIEIRLETGNIQDEGVPETPFCIAFTPTEIQTVAIAAKFYRNEYVMPHYELIDKITGLHSSDPEKGGYIIFNHKVNNHSVEIRVDLNAEQYQQAATAHAQKKQVKCLGRRLHITKKKGRFQQLNAFSLI